MKKLFNIFCKDQRQIVSLQGLTITAMGMRSTHVYKIAGSAHGFELARYRKAYDGQGDHLILEAQCERCEADFIKLMNDCRVIRWNGFHGKHPKNVSDGIMFTFSATVNGTERIEADGSANFPRGYREFMRTLDKMLYDASAADKQQNSKNLQ